MFDWREPAEWKRVWRYYQAGIINMAFGYAMFALLIAMGLNMYLAQATAHVMGMTFNYFSYSRYAFAGHNSSGARFVFSYAVNYLVQLASLAAISIILHSPYIAGIGSTVFVSAINYLVLGNFVFSRKKT